MEKACKCCPNETQEQESRDQGVTSDRSLIFLDAMTNLLTAPGHSARLFEAKQQALSRAAGICKEYSKQGIREDLLCIILKKKTALILEAETIESVRQAANPPRPRYNYGIWEEGPFWIPEEELAIWAIVSPNNKLSAVAQERYMDLFARTFGHLDEVCPEKSHPSQK